MLCRPGEAQGVDGWLSTEIEIGAAQLSAGDWLRLVWGLLWRGGVLALLAGASAVGLCALLAQLSGSQTAPAAPSLLRIAVGTLGLAVLPLYLRWLLHARFGTLRLALIRTASRD
jgi:hypothetical protein